MCISNLLIKLKPDDVPAFLKNTFFELHVEPKYDKDGVQLNPDTYVGWVHIREDGTIEFGEPGV